MLVLVIHSIRGNLTVKMKCPELRREISDVVNREAFECINESVHEGFTNTDCSVYTLIELFHSVAQFPHVKLGLLCPSIHTRRPAVRKDIWRDS